MNRNRQGKVEGRMSSRSGTRGRAQGSSHTERVGKSSRLAFDHDDDAVSMVKPIPLCLFFTVRGTRKERMAAGILSMG